MGGKGVFWGETETEIDRDRDRDRELNPIPCHSFGTRHDHAFVLYATSGDLEPL